MSDSVKDLFDEKAATWSQKYEDDGPLAKRRERLAEALLARLPPPARVLDFGCGTGDIAAHMYAQGYETAGCDISPRMLSVARHREPAIEWHQLVAGAALPFPDGAFDAIVASSVLEYVEDLPRLLSELHRLLRPSGFLVATVPNPKHPLRWMERVAGVVVRHANARWFRLNRRLDNFAGYLRISRNRYGFGRWSELFEKRGFRILPGAPEAVMPLTLLVLRRES